MDLKSLFNLDSSKYSLSNSAGAFRRVKEGTKSLSLADLLGDLIAPKIPTAAELPKVNPIDTDSVNSFMQLFGPAKGARDSLGQQLASGTNTSLAVAQSRLDSNFRPKVQGPLDQFLIDIQNAYDPYRSSYNTNLSQYNTSIKPQIDTYNSEVSAYKAATAGVQADIAEYQAEAQKRASEANVGLVNPSRVTKQTQESTGDVLAESDLYSDDLHNMMIE